MRSSCDMLARNSDLYLEVSASCSAFSSSACRACSTSILALDLLVLVRRAAAPFLAALRWSSPALPRCACNSRGERLRLLEQALGAHVGLDGVEHDADRLASAARGTPGASALKRSSDAISSTPLDLTFEDHRQHDDASAARALNAENRTRSWRTVSGGALARSDGLPRSSAHWPTSPAQERQRALYRGSRHELA